MQTTFNKKIRNDGLSALLMLALLMLASFGVQPAYAAGNIVYAVPAQTISTNSQWVWVDGSNLVDQSGVYGTEDTPDAANVPGARFGAVSWIDGSGNLWLFGGNGLDSINTIGFLNDLWKFDPGTGHWVWVDGSNISYQSGVYGTEDTPDAANIPGTRLSAVSWIDGSGDLWLFGGYGYDKNGAEGLLNDLWNFDTSTGDWTWVDGSDVIDQYGTYGTEDTPDAANVPGARQDAVSWVDGSGNLWLFGGYGKDNVNQGSANNWLNDLWKFDPGTGEWTWVDGSDVVNEWGVYGIEDTADAGNVPGARSEAVSWFDGDGDLWMFGGFGIDSTGNVGELNDLWEFIPGTGEWTWVDGSNIRNQLGVYGTEDVPNAANVPGARQEAVSWIDESGNLWVFGGDGYGSTAVSDELNDLWKFDPDSEQWTWVDGSGILNQSGSYGTEDIPDAANVPGSREESVAWTDAGGNLWLFGGLGYDGAGNDSKLNDLWRFTLVEITNTAPTANPGGPYLGAINSSIQFDGSASSDPEADSLTYAWDFGDGNNGSGAMPSHSYAATGVYDVCLTVNDGTENSAPVCTIAVVYDPSAGFVTGGGWIISPEDAYTADPSLSGKATFGFVSKYKKGVSVPTGNTSFVFDLAGFEFYSDTYEWLVVNGGGKNAQFKGSGTVNDGLDPNGNPFKFMIWAGDGSPDTFRIKIWWEDASGAENVVYDNGGQPIGAGNIVVHRK